MKVGKSKSAIQWIHGREVMKGLLGRDAGGGDSIHNHLEVAGIHPFSFKSEAVFVTDKRASGFCAAMKIPS